MKLPRFRSHKTHTLQNSSASEKETNNTYKKRKKTKQKNSKCKRIKKKKMLSKLANSFAPRPIFLADERRKIAYLAQK